MGISLAGLRDGENMIFCWTKHNAFPMRIIDDCFFMRGEFFFDDILYNRENVAGLYYRLKTLSKKEIIENILSFNGNFLLGIYVDGFWMIFSDKIMSFPLYWMERADEIIISDDVQKIIQGNNRENNFDFLGLFEVAITNYTYGNRTIYKGVKVLGPGEYLDVNVQKEEASNVTYYVHRHVDHWGFRTEKEYIELLDATIKCTFRRLIQRLNNRQAVLFLSGGYDSRLIVQQLYEFRYKNVLCISLCSNEDDLDVQVGKKIANHFGYELVTVNFTQAYWKQKSKEISFWDFMVKIANGVVFPHYMFGMVIKDLVATGRVEKNAVIMTGNSGDVLEGNDVFDVSDFNGKYTKCDIINKIVETNCGNIILTAKEKRLIFNELDGMFKRMPDKKIDFSCEEAQDLYEFFNWYNRQCKYITSDVRNYDDLSGNEWALPLWDDTFVDFWLKVPIEHRYKRKLYYSYVKKDELPTANIETFFFKFRRFIKNQFPFIWFVGHKIRLVIGFNGNDIKYVWSGLLSALDKIVFICKTGANKTDAHSAVMWKMFKTKYGIDIFDMIKQYLRRNSV